MAVNPTNYKLSDRTARLTAQEEKMAVNPTNYKLSDRTARLTAQGK
uniref:Uncharacterized protein n=1 Tax=Lutzomyia longipalpis TaxID=7200 RepID=A0A1B0C8V2_LUTLO